MTSAAIRVLELRSVRGTGGGPEKTILLGAARSNDVRLSISICYIRDDRDRVFGIDERAAGLHVDYTEIREKHSLDPAVWSALRRLVRTRQIDVVHSHDYKTDLLAFLLSRTDRIAALATAHGWTGHSARERLLYYPMDKRLLARFERVVAVSPAIREELVRSGARPDAVTVLLNGIEADAFRRDREREAEIRQSFEVGADVLVIGAVGRLEPQKRFDLLIDAFAGLAEANPRLRLLIAGEGSLHVALQAQIDRLGLSGSCRLVGHVDDVRKFHHALDLFVQSSKYEGTSNAVLEAMALETPIVATNVGGTDEQIAHGVHGLIVPSNDRPALTAAIRDVIANPGAARGRAVAARARVEGPLSFSARVKRIEAIYLELATGGSRQRRAAANRTISPGAMGL